MKKLFVIGLMIAIQPCYSQISSDLKKLSWLEGKWERTNSKAGRKGFEVWTKASSAEWTGIGVTLNGSDTTFVEKFKVVIKNNMPYYVADVPENKKEVFFKFTEFTESGFACENPDHDFPKRISYQKDGEKMKAVISGDGKSIEYLFVKR